MRSAPPAFGALLSLPTLRNCGSWDSVVPDQSVLYVCAILLQCNETTYRANLEWGFPRQILLRHPRQVPV